MEARARQVDIRHAAQDSAALGRHAAAQGRNALGLYDMRHADCRHSGTEHARTRLASEGAKLEPRRRPEVPHSGEGAHGLDGVGCPHDGHGTTKTAGSSSIHQKAAVRGSGRSTLPGTEHACTRLASEAAHPANTVADFGGKCEEQPGDPFQVVVRGAHAHIGVDAATPKETYQGHG